MIGDARKEALEEGAGREVHDGRCREEGAGWELQSVWCQERGACRVEGSRTEVQGEGAWRCRISDAGREVHKWKMPEGE
jgi:hypothetical protein